MILPDASVVQAQDQEQDTAPPWSGITRGSHRRMDTTEMFTSLLCVLRLRRENVFHFVAYLRGMQARQAR